MKCKKRERESKEEREKESRRMRRQKRKIYIFYIWGASPKSIIRPCKGARRNLGTCCCVCSKLRADEAKKKKKKNKSESSPIQLGEGTSTLRQGFISGRAFSLSGWKKLSLLFSLCDAFCRVQMYFASLCMQQVNRKVCLSYIWSTQLPLSLAAREVAFFFPYFFIHSFLFFLPISVQDYLVVIQIKELVVLSLVLHALEIHPVPQDTCMTQKWMSDFQKTLYYFWKNNCTIKKDFHNSTN